MECLALSRQRSKRPWVVVSDRENSLPFQKLPTSEGKHNKKEVAKLNVENVLRHTMESSGGRS